MESLYAEKKHPSNLSVKSKSSSAALDVNSTVVADLIHMDGPTRLELQLISQQLRVEPPPALVRVKLVSQLQSLIGNLANLPRLKSFWSEQVYAEKKSSVLFSFKFLII